MNRDCSRIDVTKLTGEIASTIEIRNAKVITSSTDAIPFAKSNGTNGEIIFQPFGR